MLSVLSGTGAAVADQPASQETLKHEVRVHLSCSLQSREGVHANSLTQPCCDAARRARHRGARAAGARAPSAACACTSGMAAPSMLSARPRRASRRTRRPATAGCARGLPAARAAGCRPCCPGPAGRGSRRAAARPRARRPAGRASTPAAARARRARPPGARAARRSSPRSWRPAAAGPAGRRPPAPRTPRAAPPARRPRSSRRTLRRRRGGPQPASACFPRPWS